MKLVGRIVVAMAVSGLLPGSHVDASVTINGTRVIYALDQREVTVKLYNDSHIPCLVQVWIDDGNANAKPGDVKVPFIITPPIFRMDVNKSQALRVIYTGDALPQDRESVFWLNMLDIPPKAKTDDVNTLQFAFRTRIKLFVRPTTLPGEAADAPARLSWKAVPATTGKGQFVSVSNPTPYHVSFAEVDVEDGGATYKNGEGGMVAPHETTVLPVEKMNGVTSSATVHYIAISDYGGAIEGNAPLGQ